MKFKPFALLRSLTMLLVLSTLMDMGGFRDTQQLVLLCGLGFCISLIDPCFTENKVGPSDDTSV